MTDVEILTAADIPLLQGLAQWVTAIRPDQMACSTIMWFDEVNRTVEFEPVGTHPGYRRRGLARAMMLYGMRVARAAGARQATVVCLGAPAHPQARGLYDGLGFRELSRDAPLIKAATAS